MLRKAAGRQLVFVSCHDELAAPHDRRHRVEGYQRVLRFIGVAHDAEALRNFAANPLDVEREMVDVGVLEFLDDAGMFAATEVRQVGHPQSVLVEQGAVPGEPEHLQCLVSVGIAADQLIE
jgi:hypothetical protein